MMQGDQGEDSKTYSGKGWNFVRFDSWPEWAAAPLTVFGSLILLCLFAVGISLILALVQRVWRDGTDTVQAASAALTAIAAIFGAAFLTWRTIVAHWQARASQEQAIIQRETLYTTMFTKAVEQLGATREVQTSLMDETTNPPTVYSNAVTEPNLEVRLGAIYALERISRDSEKDHRPILEVLCAYIRNHQNCGAPKTPEEIKAVGQWPHSIPVPRVDIQAALSVIGRRPKLRIDYERANDHYLNFTEANLQSATFFRLSYPHSVFTAAHLESAQMQRANLAHCRFTNAKLDGAGFGLANLEGANFDFASGKEVSFIHCELEAASFGGSHFDQADFGTANLDGAYFVRASLSGANFRSSSLRDTEFSHCDLNGASFDGANFSPMENTEGWRKDAKFRGAILFEATFSQAAGLKTEHLIGSLGDASVILPHNVDPPEGWAKTILDPYQRIEYEYANRQKK